MSMHEGRPSRIKLTGAPKQAESIEQQLQSSFLTCLPLRVFLYQSSCSKDHNTTSHIVDAQLQSPLGITQKSQAVEPEQ